MTFRPKHLPYQEALSLVAERQKIENGRANPLALAIIEGALTIEVCGEDGKWAKPERLPSVWFPNPLIGNYQAPGQGQVAHTSVRVATADVDRLWPSAPAPAPGAAAPQNDKFKDARGSKADPRWESILIEAARFMYAKQEAGSQTDLIAHIRQWLNDPGESISDTAMKDHLRPLWQEFKKIDGN
ncbi:hypothetical protein [Bradyrhizobium elkanii]|uniref:hypothetical protein n=1 Tax=Bradyrhizobium elkanii TaxID=29448 RepID=UPI0005706CBB|nr:hypothetical protein [Bradyrhizobium elkanii]